MRRRYDDHKLSANGWTGWITPRKRGYRLRCCDCRLVHEMDFRVTDGGQAQFRARRDNRATAASRRRK